LLIDQNQPNYTISNHMQLVRTVFRHYDFNASEKIILCRKIFISTLSDCSAQTLAKSAQNGLRQLNP